MKLLKLVPDNTNIDFLRWRGIAFAISSLLIAGMLLFYFGSGPVRGFAVVMMIGIVTSVFTAVTVTRMFVSLWLGRKRPTALHI